MSEYFSKPKLLGGNAKVELDLSNHARKEDLKNSTGVDTLKFANFNSDWINLLLID